VTRDREREFLDTEDRMGSSGESFALCAKEPPLAGARVSSGEFFAAPDTSIGRDHPLGFP